jgi:hypothetical protein
MYLGTMLPPGVRNWQLIFLFISYKYKKVNSIGVSFNFLSSEFHFVYLFSAALFRLYPGNTKGGSITVLLTSCLTGLD